MSSIRAPAFHLSAHLGAFQPQVDQVLHDMMNDRIVTRLWDHDHTLWQPEDTDISNRLGWLHSAQAMRGEQERLSRLVESIRDAGYTQALLLGMGGSSLAPAVFAQTYGTDHSPLQLAVLDSTDAGAVSAYTQLFEPARTLFLVSSKSGTTVETLSLFNHFYNHVATALPEQEAGSTSSPSRTPRAPWHIWLNATTSATCSSPTPISAGATQLFPTLTSFPRPWSVLICPACWTTPSR
jgi:hypothetical protein